MSHGRQGERPTTEDIRRIFGKFGEITSLKAGAKDFCFIDYADMESCQRAIDEMNGQPFDEYSSKGMKVKLADPTRQGAKDRRQDFPRRDDREFRRRSPDRGGADFYPPDSRMRERDDYARMRSRSRSRSPRGGDRRAGDPMLPPPPDPQYRGRSRSRERMEARDKYRDRMPDSRASYHDPHPRVGFDHRDDYERSYRGNPGDTRSALPPPRPEPGYRDAAQPRYDGRERERPDGARRPGSPRGMPAYDGRDARYDGRQPDSGFYGAREARDDYPRREDPTMGRGEGYARRGEPDPRDSRQAPPNWQGNYGGDGRRAGPEGDAAYHPSRGGPRDGGYGRGYGADARMRERDSYGTSNLERGDSRERPRADLGPPPPRDSRPSTYDGRDVHRDAPRGMDPSPPRREASRHDDYRDLQRPIATERQGGRGGDYMTDYPPRSDAVYGNRGPPRPREAERGPDGYSNFQGRSSGDRPSDAGYAGERDYQGQDYVEQGRGMEGVRKRQHPQDVDYGAQSGPPQDDWSRDRGEGGRVPDQRLDRRQMSPPRAVRGASETDDARIAWGQGASSEYSDGGRADRAAALGSRLDSLPPSDLRRSLVREVPPATGSNMAAPQAFSTTDSDTGSQQPPGPSFSGAPTDPKAEVVYENGEAISQVEAIRRRQRTERFQAQNAAALKVSFLLPYKL